MKSVLISSYLTENLNDLFGKVRSFVQSPNDQTFFSVLNELSRQWDDLESEEKEQLETYIASSSRSKSVVTLMPMQPWVVDFAIETGLIFFVKSLRFPPGASWFVPAISQISKLPRTGIELLSFYNSNVFKVLKLISGSPAFSGLKRLYFDRCLVGLSLIELSKSSHVKKLEVLVLTQCGITDEVEALCFSTNSSFLKELDLSYNVIEDAGAIAIAESPYMKHLEILDLSRCSIDDEGIKALATSPNVKGLTKLKLDGNLFGQDAYDALMQSPYLSSRVKSTIY